MTLRQTAIRNYLECPLRFRFEYLDQIPHRASPALAFGRAFHRTLERFHREQVTKLPAAQTLFEQVWAQILAEDRPRFENNNQEPEYAALGRELLEQYLPSPPAQRPPLLLEYPFALELDGHTLTGTVDRIDEADGGLVILDYKTGKRRPNQARLDDDLQFSLYSWGVTVTLDLPVVRCEYLHLRKMETFVTHRGPEHFQHLRQEVLPQVLRGIQAGVFPPSPNFWCCYCDYAYLCRARTGAS